MSVLCAMVGASFQIAVAAQILRSKKGISAVGDAKVSTAQSQFGGASAAFDGTGDYLRGESTVISGPGNWTVEMYVRFNNSTTAILYDQRTFNSGNFTQLSPVLFWENSRVIYYNGNNRITSAQTLSTGVWYHLAISKSNGVTKLFIGGTQTSSDYNDAHDNPVTNNFGIGVGFPNVYAGFNGHIDEVRISNTARYTANFTPSTTPFVNDANTLLLIHADGTNASTFFEDDNGVRSPVSLIQNTSAAVISTTQSKFGGTSLAAGRIAYSRIWSIAGADAFTFECWVYQTARDNLPTIFADNISFYINNGNPGFFSGGQRNGNIQISLNAWHHIAWVRSGGNIVVWVNGQDAGSFANSTAIQAYPLTATVGLGGYPNDTANNFASGFVDEIRVSNSARYTAAFTPHTQPHVNDANTLLLLHMDGTNASTVFRDDNGAPGLNWTGRSQLTPTNSDNLTIVEQSNFANSSSFYGTTGVSQVYVRPLTHSIGTGNYTVEGWFFRTSGSAWATFFDLRYNDANAQFWGINGNNRFYYFADGNGRFTGSTVFTTNTWYHIAISREGTNLRFWINGEYQGSISDSRTLRQNIAIGDPYFYSNNIRVSNSARYTGTSDISVPTAPFVNDANTVLLLSGNEFKDNIGAGRTQKGIQAIGNAKVSTAQSYFGGASALFSGGTQGTNTGDRLEIPYSNDWLGPTMTYEFWIRAGNNAQNPGLISFFSGTASGFVLGWAEYDDTIKWLGSPNLVGVSARASTGTVTKDIWNHVAFVVSGGNVTAYLNGVQGTTGSFSPAAVSAGTPLRIGRGTGINNGVWADTNHFTGNMDEIRVSNIARYTTGFTAPAAPFQNDANTLLLIHADGTNNSTVFTDDNGVAPDYEY